MGATIIAVMLILGIVGIHGHHVQDGLKKENLKLDKQINELKAENHTMVNKLAVLSEKNRVDNEKRSQYIDGIEITNLGNKTNG